MFTPNTGSDVVKTPLRAEVPCFQCNLISSFDDLAFIWTASMFPWIAPFTNTLFIDRNTAMDIILIIIVVWCTARMATEQNVGELSYFDALKFILNNPVGSTCSINGLTLSWWQNIIWSMQTDFWWRRSMVPYSISMSPWLNDTKRNNPRHISTPKWAIDTMSILLKYFLDISRLEMLLTCKNIEFWNGGEHISQMTCIKPWLVCTRTKIVLYEHTITSVLNMIRFLYSQDHHFAKTSNCKHYDTHTMHFLQLSSVGCIF